VKRRDWVWIAILVLTLAFVIVRANHRSLDPIIDTGRDLYIPEQIRHGVKLYSDILYYYPPVAPYLLATVTASVLACAARQRWKYLPVMPLVFACYHFGYAFGFLGGVWNFLVRGRRSHGAFESLTR